MSARIILVDPKYPHNVGGAVRAASCFGAEEVIFTGTRVDPDMPRLPREERMKGYVPWRQHDRPLPMAGYTPVVIEISPSSEQLPHFIHPFKAVYIFGPEDGSVPWQFRRLAHRFVMIPTRHCTNLAAAVYITLYDRYVKRLTMGLEPQQSTAQLLEEDRGYAEHLI